jgi:hypothetical protein
LKRESKFFLESVHGRLDALRDHDDQALGCPAENFVQLASLGFIKEPQHIIGRIHSTRGPADAHLQSQKIVSPRRIDDRSNPLMASVSSPTLDPKRPEGKVQVIMDHHQIFRARLEILDDPFYREPAQIHERLGLNKKDIPGMDGSFSIVRLEAFMAERDMALFGKSI